MHVPNGPFKVTQTLINKPINWENLWTYDLKHANKKGVEGTRDQTLAMCDEDVR